MRFFEESFLNNGDQSILYTCGSDSETLAANETATTAATTDNSKWQNSLIVEFDRCNTIPIGVFASLSSRHSTVRSLCVADTPLTIIRSLGGNTFDGLDTVRDLLLIGFERLDDSGSRGLEATVFQSLRSLEKLILARFGAYNLRYAQLGRALAGIPRHSSPLHTIILHGIRHYDNEEQLLNLVQLFPRELATRTTPIRRLTFNDNYVHKIEGRLSHSLPNLQYVSFSLDNRYLKATAMVFDLLMCMPDLEELVFYAFPFFGEVLPEVRISNAANEIRLHILQLNRSDSGQDRRITGYRPPERNDLWRIMSRRVANDCFLAATVLLGHSLRRVTVHNLRFLSDYEMSNFCFDPSNRVEFLDVAGSPMPHNPFPRIRGLNRLRYLNLSRTGIDRLHVDFCLHLPSLAHLTLSRLPKIGDFISESGVAFFSNCNAIQVCGFHI